MTDISSMAPSPVFQLRLIVEAPDYEAAVRFYRDQLGLPEQAAFEGDGDARVTILEAGRATLELANLAQKKMIDGVEAGGLPSPRIRVAFEVADITGVTQRLTESGAELVAEPRVTQKSLRAANPGTRGRPAQRACRDSQRED